MSFPGHCSMLAVRHGESEANVANLVASKPENGCTGYGLTDLGHRQAQQTGREIKQWLEGRSIDGETCGVEIWCSDFLRTRETAVELASVLDCEVHTTELLRERDFGDYELQSAESTYDQIWANDRENPDHTINNVESVRSVRDRAMSLVTELTARAASGGRRMTYVLVAHGDILQILQTQFAEGFQMESHRSLEHIEPGGWRVFRTECT